MDLKEFFLKMKSISLVFASFTIFFREKKKKNQQKIQNTLKGLLTSSNTGKKQLLWMLALLLVWEHLMLQNMHKRSCR